MAENKGTQQDLAAAIVNTFGDALLAMDETGQIVFSNPACQTLFGYGTRELNGKSFLSLIDATLHEEVQAALVGIQVDLEKGTPSGFSQQIVGLRRDGSAFPVLLILSGGQHEEQPCLSATFRQDSFTSKRQEALNRQLECAHDDLKSFAYVVSHDLKAPLRGIKTVVQWLENDCGDQLGEKAHEYLGIVHGRIDRMNRLIQGVLEYSRIGRLHEELVKVDLTEVVADIEASIEMPPDVMISIENELPSLRFEPTRIKQVLHNLIHNAVQFLDKSPGFVKIACLDQDDMWTFSVSDNGPGIAPEHRDQIFQILRTLNSRERHEGVGVGLTIAKKIVHLYGGRMWVESDVGQGSTFFFTLPKTTYRCLSSVSCSETVTE